MDSTHFDLVAWSLARVRAAADAPAKLFLARLAELDPTLLRLFGEVGANDRRAHARVHLLAAAGFRGDRARAALRAIAERCKLRPVGLRDQAVLLSAALWTLKRTLGAGFTPADREAWVAYQQQLVSALEAAALPPRGCEP
ncbi:MAG: hypothetical protein JNK68_04010 [Betaproteobacteria bacterium]|nr:hypothetical protein [Betaproteobacteria bacterium]